MDERIETAELQKRIFRIERLAAMPPVVWRLMEALGDEMISPQDLERIIESDQALTSKVLSLANSAYYGLSEKAATIHRALVVIGFRELEFLVMGAGLSEVFDLKRAPRGLDGTGLWVHCMAAAWTARELALASGAANPAEVMISGLLHDLGKLTLATNFRDELTLLLQKVAAGEPYYAAEKRLGLKHTTVGFWLAKRWGLPDVHAAAIRDHHLPQTSDPHLTTTSLVFLADGLVKGLGLGLVQESAPVGRSLALEAAGLKPEQVDDIAGRAAEEVPPLMEPWLDMLNLGGKS